ncbi:MAG TPA: transglutaminase-like domain-containing protein [Burkholderiales bacterium]|nr:transglutaminase-like domain-containing protein [Burkholderiales bacterium]
MRKAFALMAVVLLSGCSSATYFKEAGAPPEPEAATLERWAHRDVWTGVVFNGEKVGFTRRQLRPAAGAPGRWEIESEAVMRLQFLGIDKRIRLHAVDRVRPDLTLEAFRYEHEIDGSRMAVYGEAVAAEVRLTVDAAGGTEKKTFKLGKKLYPSSALAFLPVTDGLKIGKSARYSVFHGETQAIAEAEQEVLAYETSALFEGPAFKVATRMLGIETTTWIGADGRPLLELAMQGVLISALEDEARARRYLVEASLNKRDALVEFSLLRAGPIAEPRRVSRMEIVLAGMPQNFDAADPACRRAADRLECRIDRSAPLLGGDPARYLEPTLAVPSVLTEISSLARAIASGAASDEERIARLVAWMDVNIAKEAVDAFSAADVLRARRGECQGHSYLFAAFARALGLPARVVNGIAYSEEHGGFLYHTWNEVWIAGRGWQPVDATFGQAHADATHVKLIEGETAAELLPLVNLVGRVRVASVSALARW